MTLFVCDPGLQTYRGHHATVSGGLAATLRAQGRPVRLLGYAKGHAEVLAAVGAEPFFDWYAYDRASDDPLCGWLETLLAGAASVADDLSKLGLTRDDVLIWPSLSVEQLLASADLPCPVLGVLGYTCRPGPEACAWRFAARHAPGVRFAATAETHAAVYQGALSAAVPVIANPHQGPLRRRERGRGVVLGVLGHQRPAKGFGLLPGLVRRIGGAALWLVHDSGQDMPGVHDELAAMSVATNRGEVRDFGVLLDRCDALVLPYDRAFYDTTHSGLVAEAMACGMPVVVPAGSALEDQAAGYGGLVAYRGEDELAVSLGVRQLLNRFDELAEAAFSDAQAYRARNGLEAFARDLLEVAYGPR